MGRLSMGRLFLLTVDLGCYKMSGAWEMAVVVGQVLTEVTTKQVCMMLVLLQVVTEPHVSGMVYDRVHTVTHHTDAQREWVNSVLFAAMTLSRRTAALFVMSDTPLLPTLTNLFC